jgi:hypothetical protein
VIALMRSKHGQENFLDEELKDADKLERYGSLEADNWLARAVVRRCASGRQPPRYVKGETDKPRVLASGAERASPGAGHANRPTQRFNGNDRLARFNPLLLWRPDLARVPLSRRRCMRDERSPDQPQRLGIQAQPMPELAA